MKKRFFSLLLIAILLLCLNATAFADDITSGGWTMTYDGGRLTTDWDASTFAKLAGELQPGDSVTMSIDMKNSSGTDSDFWMSNEVTKNFEAGLAAGGGYIYKLTYTAPSGGTTTFYDSSAVGGIDEHDKTSGLSQATRGLTDYFFVDTLSSGQKGTVMLTVALDGETVDPNYQNKMARLVLRFGVEQAGRRFVRTGDDTQIMPWLVASAFSGLALLSIVVIRLSLDRKARARSGQ